MYSRNLLALMKHLSEDGQLNLDFDDEIIGGAVLTHAGEVVPEAVLERIKEASI